MRVIRFDGFAGVRRPGLCQHKRCHQEATAEAVYQVEIRGQHGVRRVRLCEEHADQVRRKHGWLFARVG